MAMEIVDSEKSAGPSGGSPDCTPTTTRVIDSKFIKANERDELKIVIRKLPPTMTKENFIEQVAPLPEHDYLSFMKPDFSYGIRFATAAVHIHFLNLSDLVAFKDKFDNYTFLDDRGNEYVAIVELAPFQRIPNVAKSNKRNNLINTIESDVFFQKFVEEQSVKPVSENKIDFDINLNESKKPVLTPLLEYVNKRRASGESDYGRGNKRGYERRFRSTRSNRNRNYSRSLTTGRASKKSLKDDKRSLLNNNNDVIEDIEGERKKSVSEDEFHSAESESNVEDGGVEEYDNDDDNDNETRHIQEQEDKESFIGSDNDNYNYNDNDDDIMDELIEEDLEDVESKSFEDCKHHKLSIESKEDVMDLKETDSSSRSVFGPEVERGDPISKAVKVQKVVDKPKTIYHMNYKEPLVKIKNQDYEFTQRFYIHYHYFNNYYNNFKVAYYNRKSQLFDHWTNTFVKAGGMNKGHHTFSNSPLNPSGVGCSNLTGPVSTSTYGQSADNISKYRNSRSSTRNSENVTKFQSMVQEVIMNNNQIDPSVRIIIF